MGLGGGGVTVAAALLVDYVLTVAVSGTLLPIYFIAGWIAPEKPRDLYDTPDDQKFWQGVRASPKRTVRDVRSKFRDIDRRLADVETYLTSPDRRLPDATAPSRWPGSTTGWGWCCGSSGGTRGRGGRCSRPASSARRDIGASARRNSWCRRSLAAWRSASTGC